MLAQVVNVTARVNGNDTEVSDFTIRKVETDGNSSEA